MTASQFQKLTGYSGTQPAGLARPRAAIGWTPRRVVSLVAGSLLSLVALGMLIAGGVGAWADNTQRDAAGYLTSSSHSFVSSGHALVSGTLKMGNAADPITPSDLLGKVRLRVTSAQPQGSVFVGIAPQAVVSGYLAGVSHDVVTNWPSGRITYRPQAGAAPSVAPTAVHIWAVHASGSGTQTLVWKPRPGNWAIVVMNSHGSAGLHFSADIGATFPDLGWLALAMLAAGGLVELVAGALVIVPVARAGRRPR